MFLVLFLCTSVMFGQTVKGVVSDTSGPLPGVSVLLKGTNSGTETDLDGNYSIDVTSSDAVLVFSYLGYKTKEVAVSGKTTLNVTLEEDATQLEEVIVIGYGTTTVKDATGAVSSVTSDEFNGGVISSPEQLIQGKTAGVQISSISGEPGAGISVNIRGNTSISSGNNPLFVVDGVPLSGGGYSDGANIGFGSSQAKNPLNFINPSDIESISVLKDASSIAIYGARGANGVVIITTKSGKGRKGKIEYTSTFSSAKAANTFDLLDRNGFLNALNGYGRNAANSDFGHNTDWQDVVLRTAMSHDQNISYSKAYETGSIRVTAGHALQNGIIRNSDMKRNTVRLNLTQKFFDNRLKFELTSTYSNIKNTSPALSASAGHRGDLLGSAYSANPTWPNDPTFNPGNQINPANALQNVGGDSNIDRVLTNLTTTFNITPELSLKSTVGYDESKGDNYMSANADAVNIGDDIVGNGVSVLNNINSVNKLLNLTASYNKEFDNSKLDVLVGYEYQSFRNYGSYHKGWGFGTKDLGNMSDQLGDAVNIIESGITGSYQQFGYDRDGLFVNRLFPTIVADEFLATPTGVRVKSVIGDYWDNTNEIQSFFGRINYSIKDKYLFTGTFRVDGSSSFGPDNKYGYFPSLAAAWKLNEEDFIGDAFSTLKLRANVGVTGNQNGLGYGNYLVRTRFGGIGMTNDGDVNQGGASATYPQGADNPRLKWEETTSYGVGLDFGFNNDRLTGTLEVYRKETDGLLLRYSVAQPDAADTKFDNLDAIVLNQGIEFSLNYDIISSNDLTWNMNFNIAYNKNELQDFGGQIQAGTIFGQGLTGAYAQMLAGGQPLFSYYLRQFEGFDSNGQPVQRDVQEFIGKSALPTTFGGLSTSLSYKNWDFNMYFNGQFGHYIYNNTANAFFTAGSIGNSRNVTQDVVTNGESIFAAAEVSTRFLEKGDFIRLQTASIGYNVPLKEKTYIEGMRISLTGQNLFVITDYTGLDPEVSTQPSGGDLLNGVPTLGIDYSAYPRPRTFTLGLNLSF